MRDFHFWDPPRRLGAFLVFRPDPAIRTDFCANIGRVLVLRSGHMLEIFEKANRLQNLFHYFFGVYPPFQYLFHGWIWRPRLVDLTPCQCFCEFRWVVIIRFITYLPPVSAAWATNMECAMLYTAYREVLLEQICCPLPPIQCSHPLAPEILARELIPNP